VHNEELNNLYTSQNIITWPSRAGHVTRMGEIKIAYRILV
jgi:hypothetical protein